MVNKNAELVSRQLDLKALQITQLGKLSDCKEEKSQRPLATGISTNQKRRRALLLSAGLTKQC